MSRTKTPPLRNRLTEAVATDIGAIAEYGRLTWRHVEVWAVDLGWVLHDWPTNMPAVLVDNEMLATPAVGWLKANGYALKDAGYASQWDRDAEESVLVDMVRVTASEVHS